MKKTLTYKGFVGSTEWSKDDNCYFGEVLDIKDGILYEGNTLEELEKDFHDAIDFYLEPNSEEILKLMESAKAEKVTIPKDR